MTTESKRSHSQNPKNPQNVPPLDSEALDLLGHCVDSWRSAGKRIRTVEYATNKVPMSALNEIRYAGDHLTAFLLATDREQKFIEAEKVTSHCKRAEFDAVEYETLHLLERLDGFLQHYRFVVSEKLDIENALMVAHELKRFITLRKTEGAPSSSHTDIGLLVERSVVLERAVARLEAIRPVLNTQLAKLQSIRRRRAAIMLAGGGALSLLIATLLTMVWGR